MSPVKEPHYFADDLFPAKNMATQAEYLRLFEGVTEQHQAVGEGSVYYLYSQTAVANILRFNPAARFIAMVRNPTDMAHSLHAQVWRVFDEDIADFETAWRRQADRWAGRNIPTKCREPQLLQYEAICRLGSQVARFFQQVPPDQRTVVVYDDFAADTAAAVRTMLTFLGLAEIEMSRLKRVNENINYRSESVGRFLKRTPTLLTRPYRRLQKHFGWQPLGLRNRLYQLNARAAQRRPLSPVLRQELNDTFADEVALLGQLLDRDLSHWST